MHILRDPDRAPRIDQFNAFGRFAPVSLNGPPGVPERKRMEFILEPR